MAISKDNIRSLTYYILFITLLLCFVVCIIFISLSERLKMAFEFTMTVMSLSQVKRHFDHFILLIQPKLFLSSSFILSVKVVFFVIAILYICTVYATFKILAFCCYGYCYLFCITELSVWTIFCTLKKYYKHSLKLKIVVFV